MRQQKANFFSATPAVVRGTSMFAALIVSLAISVPAFGENPQDYWRGFTLALSPKPVLARFGVLDQREVFKVRPDFSAVLADMKLPSMPMLPAPPADHIEKNDEAVPLKPRLEETTVVMQVIVGEVLGMISGIACFWAGAGTGQNFLAAIVGFNLAYPLGSALGVKLVGSSQNWTGKFGKALLGAYIGMALSYVPVYLWRLGLMDLDYPMESPFQWALILAPGPILSAIFYNASLRYKKPPALKTSVLNIQDGDIYLGFPAVHAVPEGGKPKRWRWTVALASIEF